MSDKPSKEIVHRIARGSVDIVQVIRKYVPDLRRTKSAGNFQALCPLHPEETPSFCVNREKQVYHCFGDGSGGDVIHFVSRIERIPIDEAAVLLSRWPNFKPSGTHIDCSLEARRRKRRSG